MELEELKRRQLTGQHLLEPAESLRAVGDLCGVQAQFLSNAFHAISIRSGGLRPGETDRLVKSWTIRGTVHVFPEQDLPLFLHQGRRHTLRPCDTLEADQWLTRERKGYFADLIVDNIAAGIGGREELRAVCTGHGMTEVEAESIFNPWGGTVRALCESGKICYKVQEKKEFRLCPPFEPMEEAAARLELARRYFTFYGPATVRDAAYFFAATQSQVKLWLSQLPVTAQSFGGKTYFSIKNQMDFTHNIPDCLFLAGFDPLLLGYQKTESLYLPQEHLRKIFTLAGIVMPAVLLHGRVVGKWKRTGRKLTVTLFEPVSPPDREAVAQAASRCWPDLKSRCFQ
ncbi:MAG: winged helix DNA-binding domain-containing protein [Eubacteriales bacterium]|nr:winged helix DNA-binding domain-containing protein [Eubacteriales bacterium]